MTQSTRQYTQREDFKLVTLSDNWKRYKPDAQTSEGVGRAGMHLRKGRSTWMAAPSLEEVFTGASTLTRNFNQTKLFPVFTLTSTLLHIHPRMFLIPQTLHRTGDHLFLGPCAHKSKYINLSDHVGTC